MKRRMGLSLLALVLVGCGTATDNAAPSSTTTLDPPISTTPSSTTTEATTTTSPTTTTTVFPPTEFECPPVLVSGEHVIVVDEGCGLTVAMTVSGQPVMDDLSGGLLYQTDLSSIWWLAVDSSQPVELVGTEENETVDLQDVTVADGITEAWLTHDSGTTIEDARQDLVHVSLSGASPVIVDEVGGWESSSDVTVAGDVLAYQTWAEGFYWFGIQRRDGSEIAQPWNPYPSISEPFIGCEGCPIGLVVSDDGSRVAFLEPLGTDLEDYVPYLVVIDVTSGDELVRAEIDGMGWPHGYPGAGPAVSDLDLLGDIVVLNVIADDSVLPAIWAEVTVEELMWRELPVLGRARLLRSDVQIAGSETG